MIDLRGFAVKLLSEIEPGQLFLMSDSGNAVLCLRASEQPQDADAQPAVTFVASGPTYVRYQPFTAVECVVLGKPVVRTADVMQAFSRHPSNGQPGSLILAGQTCYVIARNTFGDDTRVNLQTGEVVGMLTPKWFVTKWEIGVESGREFTSLFTWPSPKL